MGPLRSPFGAFVWLLRGRCGASLGPVCGPTEVALGPPLVPRCGTFGAPVEPVWGPFGALWAPRGGSVGPLWGPFGAPHGPRWGFFRALHLVSWRLIAATTGTSRVCHKLNSTSGAPSEPVGAEPLVRLREPRGVWGRALAVPGQAFLSGLGQSPVAGLGWQNTPQRAPPTNIDLRGDVVANKACVGRTFSAHRHGNHHAQTRGTAAYLNTAR